MLLQNATHRTAASNPLISLPRVKDTDFPNRGAALIDSTREKARVAGRPRLAHLAHSRTAVMDFSIPRSLYVALLAVVLCGGAFLRFYPTASFKARGFDEAIYASYVSELDKISLLDYPALCKQYVVVQEQRQEALPPPTRFSYIYAAHLWRSTAGDSPHAALTHVSAFFTVLTLLLTAAFCYRLGGPVSSLAVTTLMSVAMSQIHQSQHAMIDGFFAFWALLVLWALWENLRQPNHAVWLIIYAAALAVLVMTKDNAFFVFVGICGLLAANRWLKFGATKPSLILVTFGGAFFGFVGLVFLAGGINVFFEMYRLLVAKSVVLPYAIMTGDGPWYRYLVDLTLVSPLIILLAAGAAFQVRSENKPLLFLLIFLGCTFAVMASVKLGCNLRYTTIWDMPLRLLAFTQLALLATRFGQRCALVLTVATLALCVFELRQYFVFCVDWPAYALVPNDLLRATRILK